MRRIAAASQRYLDLGALVPAGTDTTVDLVEFAFLATDADPIDADWKVGNWFVSATRIVARILLGPGGTVVLTPATYRVWIRVTSSPERVVQRVGRVLVY
jgi:hypothetical protein